MDRRAIGMMAAAAAGAMIAGAGQVPSLGQTTQVKVAQLGNMQGAPVQPTPPGAGTLAEFFGGTSGYSPYAWRYRTKFPVSVAQGKRNARKNRNRLRARGHHRKAVR